MKSPILAAVLVAATATAALADGPRASSSNHWPVAAPAMTAPDPGQAPHYVLQSGYEHGGKWRSRWILVQ